jgi:Zn ribbon nucleic-acid-binding protein
MVVGALDGREEAKTMAEFKGRWCLKCCPACGGDLYVDLWESNDVKCLQCGRSFYQRTPEEEQALREEATRGDRVRLPE